MANKKNEVFVKLNVPYGHPKVEIAPGNVWMDVKIYETLKQFPGVVELLALPEEVEEPKPKPRKTASKPTAKTGSES